MKKRYLLINILIVFLIVLGMFFVYGLCQEKAPAETKVSHEEEASISSPQKPSEEQIAQEKEEAKEIDKGIFKLGSSEIKLILIQLQPLFTTEMFSVSEEEDDQL